MRDVEIAEKLGEIQATLGSLEKTCEELRANVRQDTSLLRAEIKDLQDFRLELKSKVAAYSLSASAFFGGILFMITNMKQWIKSFWGS